ncbi:Tetratricopeptide repeat-containing protein [Muriicola jejuensis]|uniref:Tetratricopeptide repeat protein n=1 Tax=Muriicola jejuensis TaxID=504488 RepID=A0A6P0U8Y6_9FLAO|nr:tetratricopeptide repeat protein [Muriicola jejuensis]NER09645.1 tetratricopeptide repeat protein [Muriicola jejuensis]SMP07068.1 Tetratricopeptide repeat-containing protein [Muriicola jejuensis]
MKKTFVLWLCLVLSFPLWGQDDFLAKQYLNNGEYEKAMAFYERLVAQNPRRMDFAENLVNCYQQLEEYAKAEAFLQGRIATGSAYPTIYIDLGYNYRLQNKVDQALSNYEKALEAIEKNPNYGYGIGVGFQRYALLDYALKAYERAMELNPDLDYHFQIALIYGEQGNIEKMFQAYLELLGNGRASIGNVLGKIGDFISEDPTAENNQLLKKVVLEKAQKEPAILWNEMLSWLFVQQRQFNSAFLQEKAIYKRTGEASMERVISLGNNALNEGSSSVASEIFSYIEKNSNDPVTKLNAQLNLIDIELLTASPKDFPGIEKQFQELVTTYGYQANTLQLQVAYANFLTFKLGESAKAIPILKRSLELPLPKYAEAYIKMALGDILVFDQRFNEALIYFSQIQKSLKNDILGQEARFKVAQTSFYKGDFQWALTQLKVLRGSTSQLTANDAMQLSLLISDNSLEDSTQTALKKYARADLLAYQNKKREAIAVLDEILLQHKGESIEDEALLKQAQLLAEAGDYDAALFNYTKIIEFYADDILADDAHFAMAELFRTVLDQPEKAKYHYEQILYKYQDSYFFPQARKYFRILRGDVIN